MLVDIFSTFDDNNFVFLSSFKIMWLLSFVTLVFYLCNKWVSGTCFEEITNIVKEVSFSQTARSLGSKMGGFGLVICSFFIVLININLCGLLPYVFSSSAHLSLSFSFGFPLWLSLVLSGMFYKPQEFVSHFLPMGAPAALSPFLVLVESVSICFRPLTISVRLVANISAGHIILGLVGSYISNGFFMLGPLSMVVLFSVEVGYFMFEIGVALIQAYIFCLLISLYSDEHPY
uniref:ATP synthase subunit a n=1 Tax=Pectinodonta sp. TaxID=3071117 RepID=A0AA96HQZ7_9GAST|nr:ATP synthase F0 subunit 6 [Pectinodonta sp.]